VVPSCFTINTTGLTFFLFLQGTLYAAQKSSITQVMANAETSMVFSHFGQTRASEEIILSARAGCRSPKVNKESRGYRSANKLFQSEVQRRHEGLRSLRPREGFALRSRTASLEQLGLITGSTCFAVPDRNWQNQKKLSSSRRAFGPSWRTVSRSKKP
jgi:hypothetical protein